MKNKMSRERWDKKKIILEILKLHNYNDDLSPRYCSLYKRKLFKAALKESGSWKNAIESAGIDYSKILRQKQWTKQEIFDKINNYYKHGINLSHKNIKMIDRKLVSAAENHFGSWANAVNTAGIDYYDEIAINKNKYWTKEKIIAEIKRLYIEGYSLNSQSMQKGEHRDLFGAAKNKLGSWENAIKNAGIDYREISKLKSQTKEYKENLKNRLSDEKLKKLVLNEKLTQLEIAEIANTSSEVIATRMKKLGLPVLNKRYGSHKRVICNDGHKADSQYERKVDDWLSGQNIPHEIHQKIIIGRNFTADFKVGKFYIEVLGLWGEKDYEKKFDNKLTNFSLREGSGFIFLNDEDDLDLHLILIKKNPKKKVYILLKPDKNHRITNKYINKRLGFMIKLYNK